MKPLCDMAQKELERMVGALNIELTAINAERRKRASHLAEVQAELTRRKDDAKFRPSVSDHALLRYIERINGFDIEGLRARIMTPGLLSALRSGAARYTEHDTTYLLRDNTVITIVDRGGA